MDGTGAERAPAEFVMTPEDHMMVAIVAGSLITALLIAMIWLRWDDVRRLL